MKTRTTFYLGTALAGFAVATFVAMYPTSADAQELKLEADLTSTNGTVSSGKAKFERKGGESCGDAGVECKIGFQAEDLPTDTMNGAAAVFNCGGPAFTITGVEVAAGRADPDDVEGISVPDCRDGDLVTVTAPDDTLTGNFDIKSFKP